MWENFEQNPVTLYPWSNGQEMDTVRLTAASMLGCGDNELALVPSTTVALNDIGEGLVTTGFLRPGDSVLTTDSEHGGGLAVWLHWQAAKVVDRIDTVAMPGPDATLDDLVARFKTALDPSTNGGVSYRVVAVSHVLTTTGLRLPLPEIAELAHAAGALFVVDGAQAPGGIAVNLTATGADAYTVSAHKWLLAPTGSGLLYVRGGALGTMFDGVTAQVVAPVYLDGGYQAYSQSSGTIPVQVFTCTRTHMDLGHHAFLLL